MKNFNKIKKILKIRPLTPKEKAILCYWSNKEGYFTETDNSANLSDILLSYRNIFDKYEIKDMITPFLSDEFETFDGWNRLIELTLDYDLKSLIFFNKYISLINERSVFIYKREKDFFKKSYSITLDKKVNIFQINDEITKSLFMFYRFLIYILTNQALLSNAFIPEDLFSLKSLTQLNNIRNKTYKNDSFLNKLMDLFKEKNKSMILDYIRFLRSKFNNIGLYYRDEKNDVFIKEAEKCLEKFYPSKNVSIDKEIPNLFDNI